MSLTRLSLARAVATTPDNFGDKCVGSKKLDVRADAGQVTPPSDRGRAALAPESRRE